MKKRILQIAMLGILGISSVFSIGQLSVSAQALPQCHGLACNDPGDCGTSCFCNNPTDTTGSCISDQ